MAKAIKYLTMSILVILMMACNNKHFINDPVYRENINKQFLKQKSIGIHRDSILFGVLNTDLNKTEEEALKFLYASMPISDLADYNGDYFLNIVRYSLKAREELPWGKVIPEDIFLHYVLPNRVNNENLDDFRSVYYNELKERIQDLELEEAILEINHWCHEKVTYKGSDLRTSGPMATIKTGFGRCGEESTLTVSALRAVAIPSRQVYVPRWSHADDNHAWVEVWLNGEWKYLGACEPAPYLNVGWFTIPATRAMFANTKAFGDYTGIELENEKRPQYSELNLLNHYAETRLIEVYVYDENNKPVENAFVEFQLYNYAEFYPLSRQITSSEGKAEFQTGYGDLLLWVAKDDKFSFRKINTRNTDKFNIILNSEPGVEYSIDFNINVPEPVNIKDGDLGDKDISERLKYNDRKREEYALTFMKDHEAYSIADKQNFDREKVWDYIKSSYGNWEEISKFCSRNTDETRPWAMEFLGLLSKKDLRDVVYDEIYKDFLYNSSLFKNDYHSKFPKEIFTKYLLSPRIHYEQLKPYKKLLQYEFGDEFIKNARADINNLLKWIRSNIQIYDDLNYYDVPMSPKGVYDLKAADHLSVNIFFVAACRSFGIPARYDKGHKISQYYINDQWTDVFLTNDEFDRSESAIRFINNETFDPEYYIHFTLAKFANGKYYTIGFDYNKKLSHFPEFIELGSGSYMLTTGKRLDNGNVLTNMSFFNLLKGETKDINVILRQK